MIGTYRTYKGTTYLVTKTSGKLVQILNPLNGNGKLSVNLTNTQATNYRPAVLVEHQEKEYIVTAKGCIISRATARVMKWGPESGTRKAILNCANVLFTNTGV